MPAAVPYFILAIAVVYLAVLVFSFFRARQGRMRSAGAGIALIVAVAVLGVLPTEIVSIMWITVLQRHAEVTANLFMLIPVPIVAAMVAVQGLVLARVYRLRPLLLGTVYLGVFAAAYAFFLHSLFNPLADIARYVVVILLVGGATFGIIWRFVWRQPSV